MTEQLHMRHVFNIQGEALKHHNGGFMIDYACKCGAIHRTVIDPNRNIVSEEVIKEGKDLFNKKSSK